MPGRFVSHVVWAASAACLSALSLPAAFAQPVCRYEVVGIIQGPELPFWGHPATIATGLNNHGEVVGYYSYVGDARAFYWSQETGFVTLPPIPGAYDSQATDINDHGVIVGYARGDNWGMTGWVFENGHYTYLSPLPGGAWIEARAINNHGQVVGYRSIGDAQPGGPDADTVNPWAGFIWERGVFTDLVLSNYNTVATDINDAGEVVGWTGKCEGCADATAFWYSSGRTLLLSLPSVGAQCAGRRINNHGSLVGATRPLLPTGTLGPPTALMWSTSGSFQVSQLQVPPGYNMTVPNAIGPQELVAGWVRLISENSTLPDRGVVWINGAVRFLSADGVDDFDTVMAVNEHGMLIASPDRIPCDTCSLALIPVYELGDLNRDCVVDGIDLLTLLSGWGGTSDGDLNGDGVVGLSDLGILLMNWS